VIGVHIGVGLFRVAITNLCAEILHSHIEPFDIHTPAIDVLENIIAIIQTLISEGQIDRKLLLGIGVGASGLVDYQTGVNILAPNLGWHDIPIQTILETSLNLPVTVDNNVRAMALGEAYFGQGRGIDSLAFVYGRTGVGAGFVVDGKVFRGAGAGAGELGHVIMVPEGGEACRCGQNGCLETLVSEQVILRRAETAALKRPEGQLAACLRNPGEGRPIEAVFRAARLGDPDAADIVEQVGCYLGIALANLINIFNPELILLGGMYAQAEDLIVPQAAKTMRNMAFAGMGEKVRLQTTGFGWRAGVIGAAALALMSFFYDRNQ
jgi:glucokinase-like ROK family protein